MNKEEIVYERDIHHSYMKVPALQEESLDVCIMLHQKIKGMMAVERCYRNEEVQYWYDISGKQALSSFVEVHLLTYALFEKLILRICEQLEILEWNLLDENGLILDPEYIFLNNQGEKISFIFYPHKKKNVRQELQKLLEYLLAKLDHTQHEVIQGAYEVYELTLSEGYHLQELKSILLKRRISENVVEEPHLQEEGKEEVEEADDLISDMQEGILQEQIREKIQKLCEKIKRFFHLEEKDESPSVMYPEEEEKSQKVVHPTVCIVSKSGEPKGMLLYEGRDGYSDFELHKMGCTIGKSSEVSLQIDRETISNFHAKIEYRQGYYIEDMNSTNGTFVNEEILNYKEQRELHIGDVIRFADMKYRFF